MKFLNIKYFNIILFSSVILFSACDEEEITLNLDSSPVRLVVDGMITTDTMAHCVSLSLSSDYFYNKPAVRVSGAKVTISDGDETFELVESETAPGKYYTPADYFGKQNHLYTLEITGVDLAGIAKDEVFSAESYLHSVLTVDYLEVDYTTQFDLWKVLLYAQDPAEENFYLFKLLRNGKLITDEYAEMSVTNDEYFDGNYIDGVWLFELDYEDRDEDLQAGDVLTVESYMIDENYYDFLVAAQEETSPKNPLFSTIPANVPGNISNGALGVFTACSVFKKSVIVKWSREEMENMK